jgi:hypothetical protein
MSCDTFFCVPVFNKFLAGSNLMPVDCHQLGFQVTATFFGESFPVGKQMFFSVVF